MGRTSGFFLCALVPILALAGFVVVAARVIERSDAALGAAGLQFLLSGAARTVELNLQLGLPLVELQQVDTILENAVASTPDVLAADVIGRNGVTLFSTDRGAVGEPVPRAWAAAMADGRGAWKARERETVTLGQPIMNDFGQLEGWVAIIVDADRLTPPLSRTQGLFVAAAPAIGAAMLLAVLFGTLVAMRSARRVDRVAKHLRGREPVVHPLTLLEDAANAAVHGLKDAEERVERVQRDLRRLDAEI
ncbi:PDC sensor domain-containing protein [Acuticoccus sp. I52.16.1]|uniref:PDC sensor domain-containing protein n=1 Tax=Acuticoccus sp. I52.16.1 TaxID=2928472 RepID=UPI001FCFBC86|nr:PDC sensor domain-containing protein [Acuticoccus sp. I52.16.1]UOM32909.1 PDC sensor domain-containing protein [Acuticoccus sp. I52.16.1]